MDTSQLLLAAAAALLINGLFLYYVVRQAVKDAQAKLFECNQELLVLKKIELRRSGISENELTRLMELGKLEARFKDLDISQNDYDAEKEILEASN
jgi:hypothetical protein